MKRSLATPDQQTAQRRWQAVTAEVDRLFAEAEAALKNPSIAAYKAIEEWKQDRAARPVEQHEEEALDSHLTTLLERNNLDQHQRAVMEGSLRRQNEGGADNPPLTILFERYYSERKLPAKTKLEWNGVLKRFTASVSADLPVRAITPAHVRSFKTALLASTSKRTGRTVSAAMVQKTLNALRSILSWGKREAISSSTPLRASRSLSRKPILTRGGCRTARTI